MLKVPVAVINEQPIQVKVYENQRVLTLKDIDQVHGRTAGTSERNFRHNKARFIEGIDFFTVKLTNNEIRCSLGIDGRVHKILLFTLQGYLMLVKSFTDDLAWKVQRELVSKYFEEKSFLKECIVEDKSNELLNRLEKDVVSLQTLLDLYKLYDKGNREILSKIKFVFKILAMETYNCAQDFDKIA